MILKIHKILNLINNLNFTWFISVPLWLRIISFINNSILNVFYVYWPNLIIHFVNIFRITLISIIIFVIIITILFVFVTGYLIYNIPFVYFININSILFYCKKKLNHTLFLFFVCINFFLLLNNIFFENWIFIYDFFHFDLDFLLAIPLILIPLS